MPSAPWYVEAFRADYLEVYPHRDDAAAAEEAKGALNLMRFAPGSGRLLDLAAGTGRHAIALARERCRVVCVDLSRDLARRCSARGLRTVRADMRALPFRPRGFAAVTMFFTSFGYFEDDAQHERVLREIAGALAPGGVLLLDLLDRDTVRFRLKPQSVDIVDETTIEVERRLIRDGERVEKSIRLLRSGSEPRAWTESVRLFTEDELSALATRAGLTIASTHGDFSGREHVPGETRLIAVLRRTP